jgi:hypothetical protein
LGGRGGQYRRTKRGHSKAGGAGEQAAARGLLGLEIGFHATS